MVFAELHRFAFAGKDDARITGICSQYLLAAAFALSTSGLAERVLYVEQDHDEVAARH